MGNIHEDISSREARLQYIRGLFESTRVESQAEVLEELRKQGFTCTQATLSRDFHQLKVVKRKSVAGKKYYALPKPKNDKYRMVAADVKPAPKLNLPGFCSIDFSGNMAVIKTSPGYAPSIAYHIDECGMEDILGTIAGDDTVFCVIKEDTLPIELTHKLEYLFNERS